MMNNSKHIQYLLNIMEKADKAYWSADTNNIISDGEYDTLYMHLKHLHQKYPDNSSINNYFSTVHHDTTNTFKKHKQLYHVISLDKIRTKPEVIHFINKWNTNPNSLWYTKHFLIEHKEDGISSVFYFNDSRMPSKLTVLTRGSGVAGADITPEAYYFKGMDVNHILKNLHGKHLVVRGELLISHHDFKRLNKLGKNHFENCRNLASGSVFNKNPKVAGQRGIFLSAYTILDQEDWGKKLPTELQQMKFLKNLGFTVTKNIKEFDNTKRGKQALVSYVFHFTHAQRMSINHDIDGLVIKPNYVVNKAKLGWNKHGPRYSQAFKFPPQQALTRVERIRYQISASGRLTPVIIFSHPVSLFGATIRKCTGSSIGNMEKNHIYINGYVTVKRMNDVIPKAFGNVSLNRSVNNLIRPLSSLPNNAVKKGKFYYIPRQDLNDSETVLLNRWQKFVSKPCLNIKGLSSKMLKTLIDNKLINVHDFSSLWRINKDQFLATAGFAKKGWVNLQHQLKKASHVNLDRILLGLPINNTGLSALTPISKKIGDMKRVLDNIAVRKSMEQMLLKEIPNINGLGSATIPTIKTLFSNPIIQQLKNLEPYLDMTEVKDDETNSHKLSGKHFAITGRLSHPRKVFTNLIKNNGGTVQSSVNGKTDYLICNQKSNSSKYKQAVRLRKRIINENMLMKLL